MANNIEKQLKEISERLEQGVKEIFTSERYTEYLNTMSKFHNYSFNNTLLITIEESIKKLPEDLQEVVILHYFQDLKLKEVADIIGIGLPLVKYRIGKAKELLSVYLGDKK